MAKSSIPYSTGSANNFPPEAEKYYLLAPRVSELVGFSPSGNRNKFDIFVSAVDKTFPKGLPDQLNDIKPEKLRAIAEEFRSKLPDSEKPQQWDLK